VKECLPQNYASSVPVDGGVPEASGSDSVVDERRSTTDRDNSPVFKADLKIQKRKWHWRGNLPWKKFQPLGDTRTKLCDASSKPCDAPETDPDAT
jgi:hypothetical protein